MPQDTPIPEVPRAPKDKPPIPEPKDKTVPKPREGGEGQDPTKLTLDDAQKALKALREENASHRIANKELTERLGKFETGLKNLFGGGDGDDNRDTPESRIDELEERFYEREEQLEAEREQNVLLSIAYRAKIPDENLEYFEFLMEKEIDNAGEDGVTDARVQEVIKKVKGLSAPASTSVSDGPSSTPAPAIDIGGDVDLDRFVGMKITERQALYNKNKELYESLHRQAREQNRLV